MRVEITELESHNFGPAEHQGVPFTGTAFEVDDHGTIIAEVDYKDGIEDGPSREWYADGSLRAEGTNRNGIPVGEYREWHPGGLLAEETRFNDEGKHIYVRRWDEEGNITADRHYDL